MRARRTACSTRQGAWRRSGWSARSSAARCNVRQVHSCGRCPHLRLSRCRARPWNCAAQCRWKRTMRRTWPRRPGWPAFVEFPIFAPVGYWSNMQLPTERCRLGDHHAALQKTGNRGSAQVGADGSILNTHLAKRQLSEQCRAAPNSRWPATALHRRRKPAMKAR